MDFLLTDEIQLVIFGLVGILVLYIILKLLKLPLKILINSIVGMVLLYITNYLGAYVNFSIDINIINSLIAGFLGVPGVAILIILKIFI